MRTFFGLAAGFLLASCATAGQQQATQPPPPPITCSDKADCDAKWSRAISWIANNSSWKIQTQTDFLVQTYNSIDDSAAPGYIVTKVAKGTPGAFEITFTGGCDNILGCIPTVAEARARFTEFVNAGATATSFAPEPDAAPANVSSVLWARKDGRRIAGNPQLESEERANRAECQAEVRDAKPANSDSANRIFIACRKRHGYELITQDEAKKRLKTR